ncbi:hypothetical protein MSG_00599 [Mycobacterium shigaense]|uniref:Uncharacterized protein n=1 Tax=Mycobacterium shigaense TaxID=722731 RepID=A0A1Z4ECU0_9MYCO|nr:hypothetical protein MSG_00599 [Mycobacterium shigaense]
MAVFTLIDQFGEVDVQAELPPAVDEPAAGLEQQRIPGGNVVGGEPAARSARRCDVAQQPVLRGRRQVTDQQVLGDPHGGKGGVETHPVQRGQPVLTQVDADCAAVRGQLGAQPTHDVGLEIDDGRLVEFVDRGARRPPQPVGPGIQARGEQDDLADAGASGVGEKVVEVPGVRPEDGDQARGDGVGIVVGIQLVCDHLGEVK